MGLTRYALAFGLGYTLGRPDGRQKLTDLRQQMVEFSRRPEVKRLRERGWDLTADGLRAARSKLPARSRAADIDGQPAGDRLNRGWRRPATAATRPASAESGDGPSGTTPTAS